MPAQLDIFTYPISPGSKTGGTSSEAAASMRPSAATLREKCLRWLRAAISGATADEMAAAMGESVLSIRPRFSELHALKLIEDSGLRRTNASGRSAVVWRVKSASEGSAL